MKKSKKILSAILIAAVILSTLCIFAFAAEPAFTTIESNSDSVLSGKWVSISGAAAALSVETAEIAEGKGNAAKAVLDRTKNEWQMSTFSYNYEANVTAFDGIRFIAKADKALNCRVVVVLDWEKQFYIDIDFGTSAKEYTINLKDCASYNDPVPAYSGSHNLTQVIFQYGRNGGDNAATMFVDELQYFTGDAATGSFALTSEFTMFEANGADTLNGKWVSGSGEAAVLSLDTVEFAKDKGNSVKATLDRAKNEWQMSTFRYDYEANVTAIDGIRFIAQADKAINCRVVIVLDWEKQFYTDLDFATTPKQFTINLKDCAAYNDPIPSYGGGHNFTQIIFQYGRNGGDNNAVVNVDELEYFTGGVATGTVDVEAAAVEEDSVYTSIETNSADTLNGKWTSGSGEAAVLSLNTVEFAKDKGNYAKATLDRAKNEWQMSTFRYDYEANVTAIDGIRFIAQADKAINCRVVVVIDWEKQFYIDVDFATTPKQFTINLKDCASYNDPVPSYAGGHNFTQIIFQYGRNGGDNNAVVNVDELDYFTGGAATGTVDVEAGVPSDPDNPDEPNTPTEPATPDEPSDEKTADEIYAAAEKKLLIDFEKQSDVDGMTTNKEPAEAVTFEQDKTGKLGEGNSLKATLKRSNNVYSIATLFCNPEIKFDKNYEGISFIACAESPCETRVALVLTDYKQCYIDIQLTTEPQRYCIAIKDMKPYPGYRPAADITGNELHQVALQVGRTDGAVNNAGPDENIVWLDTVTLYKEKAEAEGEKEEENPQTGDAYPVFAVLALLASAAAAVVIRKRAFVK